MVVLIKFYLNLHVNYLKLLLKILKHLTNHFLQIALKSFQQQILINK